MESRSRQVEAARGERRLDLIIENARLVNVYTREIYPAEIGIYDGVIVSVEPPGSAPREAAKRIDAAGKFAVPGLIDAHVHIESSMMSPAGFAAAILPRGTTTIVTDPHEIGNVLGLRGVRYMLEATAALPLRVYVQAPSCIPAVPGLETAGASFGPEEIAEMLCWERVIGLAEVMDYVGVVQQSERMHAILEAAHRKETVISGHCPGLRGRDLAAYMIAGPVSDHESIAADELLEKLRAGMTVEGRVSSFGESVSLVGKIVQELGSLPPNLVFCTDDIYPDDLLYRGHMDEVVRAAIRAGIPPVDAIRASTLNSAIRHRLHSLGAIAPGKWADLLLVPDLETFVVDEVFARGELVASGGKYIEQKDTQAPALEQENTIHLPHAFTGLDFQLRTASRRSMAQVHVLVIHPDLSRSMEEAELPVMDGCIDYSGDPDLCLVSVIERHGKGGGCSLALARGLGIRSGAAATTVAHDCHNLVIVGRDPADMALAAQTLAGCGGGICSVQGGTVQAVLPLPIAGLMSPQAVDVMAAGLQKVNAAMHKQGFLHPRPIAGLLALALPVIPAYGVTDLGLVDVARQAILPVEIDEATDGEL